MSYRVKRIDPYWIKNPVLPVVAVVGVLAALGLISKDMPVPAVIAAVVAGVAVVLSTQPAVSAVTGTLGLIGGLTTFILVPNSQNAPMAFTMKLLSTLMFALFYVVLMDGAVLMISVLYNLFAGAIGLGGLSVDLEDGGGEGGA